MQLTLPPSSVPVLTSSDLILLKVGKEAKVVGRKGDSLPTHLSLQSLE